MKKFQQCVVGRNGEGKIVLDATQFENPAVSVRIILTPEDAATLADQLSEHANDDDSNRVVYPESFLLTPEQEAYLFDEVAKHGALDPHEIRATREFFNILNGRAL